MTRSPSALALLLALPVGLLAAPGRPDPGRPRPDSAPLVRHRDYRHSVRCAPEVAAGAGTHDLEVLRAPVLPLAAQAGEDAADLRSWFPPPLAPPALLVRARGYRESVECGQDGPLPTEVLAEALRAMPELSLRRQEALATRELVQDLAPALLPRAGGGGGD